MDRSAPRIRRFEGRGGSIGCPMHRHMYRPSSTICYCGACQMACRGKGVEKHAQAKKHSSRARRGRQGRARGYNNVHLRNWLSLQGVLYSPEDLGRDSIITCGQTIMSRRMARIRGRDTTFHNHI